mmetsp:Transcript_16923/g.34441  ORF Transcript_16923/g.34441 Transcript_16923/m.34441 type:complete len:336 (+) Transcript_16923:1299-2306(+)
MVLLSGHGVKPPPQGPSEGDADFVLEVEHHVDAGLNHLKGRVNARSGERQLGLAVVRMVDVGLSIVPRQRLLKKDGLLGGLREVLEDPAEFTLGVLLSRELPNCRDGQFGVDPVRDLPTLDQQGLGLPAQKHEGCGQLIGGVRLRDGPELHLGREFGRSGKLRVNANRSDAVAFGEPLGLLRLPRKGYSEECQLEREGGNHGRRGGLRKGFGRERGGDDRIAKHVRDGWVIRGRDRRELVNKLAPHLLVVDVLLVLGGVNDVSDNVRRGGRRYTPRSVISRWGGESGKGLHVGKGTLEVRPDLEGSRVLIRDVVLVVLRVRPEVGDGHRKVNNGV